MKPFKPINPKPLQKDSIIPSENTYKKDIKKFKNYVVQQDYSSTETSAPGHKVEQTRMWRQICHYLSCGWNSQESG